MIPGNDGGGSVLNSSQIELLQTLIRQFKVLGQRYSSSTIPGLIEKHTQNAFQERNVQNQSLENDLESSTSSNNNESSKDMSFENKPLVPLPLSWQCFHSLLFYGVSRIPMEGFNASAPSDLGCFSKGANLPLTLTLPSSHRLREVLVRSYSDIRQKSISVNSNFELVQRQMRSTFLKNWIANNRKIGLSDTASTDLLFAENVNISSFHRHKRHLGKNDSKRIERDDRRRREVVDKKKKILSEFHRSLLDHRENFLRFQKNYRLEQSKAAKNVKALAEALDSRRQKDELRVEQKRLQALKENDLEAYASLLQDTKNGRLKYLLNETEKYIETVNQLVMQQRTVNDDAFGDTVTSEDQNLVVDVKASLAAKNYLRSTHRNIETVIQPRMLRGGDLTEYQIAGLQWMVSLYNNNLNGILADEMGLGKTIQSISLLAYLMEIKQNMGPFLVVVPLSTISNWVNEFSKWAPDIIKVQYKGNPDERKRIYKDEIESRLFNVLITTYDYIMKDKAILKKMHWEYIIVDEGHRMKNADSKFAQTLGSVYQSRHRLLLTGTPLQNNLPELWALLNFLLPTIFSSLETFDQWFNKPFFAFRNQSAAAEDASAEESVLSQEERLLVVCRLHELLRPFVLRRVKDQVLDQLPDKVEIILRCSLSAWQKQMYCAISRKAIGGESSASSGLNNAIMQLRKVCNHPYLFLADYVVDENIARMSGKFQLLDRMLPKLKAAGHRVLIFSQMVEVINCLTRYFEWKHFAYLRLDGSTAAEEREKGMYAFNDPNSPYFVFLLSTRAGGLGLNLATADTVIIFDSDWNPMADAQAQDRAHRIGQKNEVRVFRLVTTTPVEERILARANDKKNLTGLVVEAGKFNARSDVVQDDNKEMMESLLNEWMTTGPNSLGESGLSDDAGVVGDDEINQMMAIYEGELDIYNSIDARRCESGEDKSMKLLELSEIPWWFSVESCIPKYNWLFFPQASSGKPSLVIAQTEEPTKQSRKRREVTYDDGLSESQFLKQCEYDDDERPLLSKSTKRPKTSDGIWKSLISCVSEVSRESYSELFRQVPSKQLYRDYYVLIKHPISLKEIVKKLKAQSYQYFEDLENDLALMCDNARIFNGDDNIVAQLAEQVRSEIYARWKHDLHDVGFFAALNMPTLEVGQHIVRTTQTYLIADIQHSR